MLNVRIGQVFISLRRRLVLFADDFVTDSMLNYPRTALYDIIHTWHCTTLLLWLVWHQKFEKSLPVLRFLLLHALSIAIIGHHVVDMRHLLYLFLLLISTILMLFTHHDNQVLRHLHAAATIYSFPLHAIKKSGVVCPVYEQIVLDLLELAHHGFEDLIAML